MKKERAPKNKEKNVFGLTIDDSVIKLVSLGSQKLGSKVNAYHTATLEPGIVDQGMIKKPKALAKKIQQALKSAKPRSVDTPFCVIGLPENQIFIQTIEVPKDLTDPEISRTIEHQSDRYFPISYKDIILDWQVIGEKNGNDQILIIAAPEDTIQSIVETAKLAKIIPLAVEPKSFAIHRLLNYILKKQSLIMVDFEEKNASLSVYQAGEIKFHTKIPAPLTVEGVAGAISRTIHYYRDKNPKASPVRRIIFSGDTGEKYFMEQISAHFKGIQVERMTLPDFRAPDDFNQRKVFHASAISLAMKDINILAKHKGINLLPTDIKQRYRNRIIDYYFGLYARLSVWLLTMMVAGLAILGYRMSFESERLASLIKGKESYQAPQSLQQKEKIVEQVNRKSQQVIKYNQIQTNNPQLLSEIMNQIPAGVNLTSIKFENQTGTINGIGTRNQIIKFSEKLESNSKVSQVNLPLSSLEKEKEADFQITFNYLP